MFVTSCCYFLLLFRVPAQSLESINMASNILNRHALRRPPGERRARGRHGLLAKLREVLARARLLQHARRQRREPALGVVAGLLAAIEEVSLPQPVPDLAREDVGALELIGLDEARGADLARHLLVDGFLLVPRFARERLHEVLVLRAD